MLGILSRLYYLGAEPTSLLDNKITGDTADFRI
jgi:hypothetical protein